jgi:hypothetical protein
MLGLIGWLIAILVGLPFPVGVGLGFWVGRKT